MQGAADVPPTDLQLIVPNGCVKLVLPYRERIFSHSDGSAVTHLEMMCTVIGQMEAPSRIVPERGTCAFGMGLRPETAYRFFPHAASDLARGIYRADEIWGSGGAELRDRMGTLQSVEERVNCFQSFLLSRLDACTHSDAFVEFAVKEILRQRGRVSIEELCRDGGYSRQHVDRKFAEFVGLSPKKFAGIIRFYHAYKALNGQAGERGESSLLLSEDDLYEDYYDQSHFIREFKRYTGVSPRDYKRRSNSFGKQFLR